MAIEGFDYQEEYVGTGDTTDYQFSFFIYEPSDLYIYIQDQLGNIVTDTRGDDISVVASLLFATDEGGGTLSLLAPLPNQYRLLMLLANDAPDQPTDFPNKRSFNFKAIEGALDYIASWGQRIAYLAQRAIRLHDVDDIDGFDMRLPQDASGNPNAILQVNANGNGWAFGPSYLLLIAEINAALLSVETSEATATAASAGAIAAETAAQAAESAAAASAAAAAASAASAGQLHTGPFAAIAPNANADLTGELTDHIMITMVEFTARIRRGTLVYAKQQFTIFYRNGGWKIATGPDLYDDAGFDHGVTFTVNSSTGQINAAVANDGGPNATIDLDKINWAN